MPISPPLTPTGVATLAASSVSSRVALPTAGTPTAVQIVNLGPVLFSIGANTYLAAITEAAAAEAVLNLTLGT